ncbi:MAG: hypothetical protein AAF821_16725 [Cyanobacteria bacterium P01_D01_bin.156]
MTVNQQLFKGMLRAAIPLIILLTVLVSLPDVAWAASNQALQQPATLIAPKPSYKIAIYPQPDQRKRRIAYGMGGDTVKVLEQVGSNQGITWNHIRFDNPPYTDGWVQEKFLLLSQQDSELKQQNLNQTDGQYRGNQNTNSQDRSQSHASQNRN